MPIVSVIIPCYNQGAFVDEAVESVLNQSFQDFEIIIINPDSTDELTNEKLKNYSKPKTKVIHTVQQKAGQARNMGIRASSGEYILPLDADDIIMPDYINEAVGILDNNSQIAIVYCDAEFIGQKQGKVNLPPYSLEQMLKANVIFNSSFFRRSDYNKTIGYNPNMIYEYEDWNFWLSLIELGGIVVKIEKIHFQYRIHQQGKLRSRPQEFIELSFKQLFLNHAQLYITNFPDPLNLYYENNKLKAELDTFKNSKEYKLGKTIFNFLRKFKRIFQKK
jgi:glycosyltransferase involved in cell wall biosynthesis